MPSYVRDCGDRFFVGVMACGSYAKISIRIINKLMSGIIDLTCGLSNLNKELIITHKQFSIFYLDLSN